MSGPGALGAVEVAVRRADQTASRSARVIEAPDELDRGDPGRGEQSRLVGALLPAVLTGVRNDAEGLALSAPHLSPGCFGVNAS